MDKFVLKVLEKETDKLGIIDIKYNSYPANRESVKTTFLFFYELNSVVFNIFTEITEKDNKGSKISAKDNISEIIEHIKQEKEHNEKIFSKIELMAKEKINATEVITFLKYHIAGQLLSYDRYNNPTIYDAMYQSQRTRQIQEGIKEIIAPIINQSDTISEVYKNVLYKMLKEGNEELEGVLVV